MFFIIFKMHFHVSCFMLQKKGFLKLNTIYCIVQNEKMRLQVVLKLGVF